MVTLIWMMLRARKAGMLNVEDDLVDDSEEYWKLFDQQEIRLLSFLHDHAKQEYTTYFGSGSKSALTQSILHSPVLLK